MSIETSYEKNVHISNVYETRLEHYVVAVIFMICFSLLAVLVLVFASSNCIEVDTIYSDFFLFVCCFFLGGSNDRRC